MAAVAGDSAMEVVPVLAEEAAAEAAGPSCLVQLPGEVLEYILCSGSLTALDIGRVSSTCRRLREVCQSSGQVWKEQFRDPLPAAADKGLGRGLRSPDGVASAFRDPASRSAPRLRPPAPPGSERASFVARSVQDVYVPAVPCNGFSDIENLEGPEIFFEDELVCILNMEGRKALTWKYYAKKILYYLRQQKILNNLKAFLQQPDDYESYLEGAVYIDQYCNPLSDISLRDIQAQIHSIVELVCKTLRGINSRHPSLTFRAGESSMIMEIELQSQVLDAINYVLYDQLKFKGNRMDYYNALNLYMHQVLTRRTGIPISMSLLYLTIARQLGVPLEPVNFPSHFLLRWCQGAEGATLDIFDYIYIDAFGKGKQLTVKECEYLIGQHVTAALYGVVNVKKVLQRMVGNLLSLGKREGIDQSYQLLRDSLDLYLAMYPDQVQLLLLQARLYFHLGIWPEKVLDILQHIQTLDPGQHGAVGYLVQHTLEHIERKKEEVGVEVKLRSEEKHRDVCYSIGLVMKHKRYGYNCVIYGWDPTCMMGHEWIRNMNVHSLPHGHHQPFYNVLVEDGSCRYAAQGHAALATGLARSGLGPRRTWLGLQEQVLVLDSTENLEYNVEPQEISHPDVGRYFSEFTGTHYIPNAELEIRYPEDLEFVYETVQNIYSAKEDTAE
ncbi:F-box only protein 21 [Microtus ochrogaster]|uniref:F-box only protein 21 n=1 Tax=Microtus ochrogaster TaxID=79684 RepID=A0A8J6KXS5_MICOH|nr:F-box only protein 21 [Microtus ochrogaster]